jgi:hypothetical protein
MHIPGLVLGAATVVLSVTSASATMRIADDRGGQIGRYLEAFTTVRSSGERVVIDGNCLSACTLVLGLVPHERIYVTHRARFGFHAAWMPDRDGRPVTSPLGTQALWSVYPASVRRWILTHGGLSREMIFLQGRDLNGIVSRSAARAGTVSAAADAESDALQIRKRLQRSPLNLVLSECPLLAVGHALAIAPVHSGGVGWWRRVRPTYAACSG